MIKKELVGIYFFILIVLFINFVNSETLSKSCLSECKDNGKVSDVYNKGQIEFQGQTYTDSCKDGIETEVSCDGNNKIKKEVFICSGGCKDEFSCSDISIEVEIKVPEKYKKEHALPNGEMEYEKAGLDELKADGKCLDCGTQEDKEDILGIVTEYDDLEIKAIITAPLNFNPAGYNVRFKIEGADIEGEMMLGNCDFADNKYTCIENFEGAILKRGIKINAKVDLIKNSETIQTKKSKSFVVAGFNYYFLKFNEPDLENIKEQYALFIRLSQVDKTLAESGKPLYLTEKLVISKDDVIKGVYNIFMKVSGETYDSFKSDFKDSSISDVFSYLIGSSGILLSSGKEFFLNLKNSFDPNKGDRIILYSKVYKGGVTGADKSIIVVGELDNTVLAHELGHTFNLIDEYAWKYNPGDFLFGGVGGAQSQKGDNPYPWCCLDNPNNELQKKIQEDSKKEISIEDLELFFGKYLETVRLTMATKVSFMAISYDSYFPELTDEDLIKLRKISPCEKNGGKCLYVKAKDIPTDKFLIISSFDYTFCPKKETVGTSYPSCVFSRENMPNYGNQCWPINSLLTDRQINKCAGMPLDNKQDLNSPFRSVMGSSLWEDNKVKYPPEARWPLTENKKGDLVFEEGKKADETQLMFACQEKGKCTKKTYQELLVRAEIHNWEIELKKEFGADYKTLKGYTPLDEKLIYAMMNVEASSEISKTLARKYDPMQIANAGDFALGVLRDGKEGLTAYSELANIQNTPWKRVYNAKKREWEKRLDYNRVPIENRINEKLSVEYGIRWLWHKKKVRDNQGKIVSFRTWEEAVGLYNGGGDPQYLDKVKKEYKKLGGNWKDLQ